MMWPASAIRFFSASVLWIWLMFALAAGAAAEEPLSLGVHPFLPAPEIEARFSPITRYLAAALGREVVLRVAPSYTRHISRIGRGGVDFAYLGPASYVEMVSLHGPRPLLGRLEVAGSPLFSGTVFVRSDSSIKSLADLRGQRMAFGDVNSPMSYLVPRQLLLQAGIELDDLAGYQLLGNQANVALAVLSGHYAAGAVKTDVYDRYAPRGLRSIVRTPPVSEHLFVASNGMNPRLVEQLRILLVAMSGDATGLSALRALQAEVTGIVPVRDSDYDSLRALLGPQAAWSQLDLRDE